MTLAQQFEPATAQTQSQGLTVRSSWAELIDNLLAMYQLNDDWDGQGAKAPTKDVVRAALLLCQDFKSKYLAPADRCIAGVNGTIFLEWHGNSGEYMEVEIETPDRAEIRLVKNNSTKTEILKLPRQS